MSLAASEQRELARMERALSQSDPKLAALLATFNRLHQSEDMPRREFLLGPTGIRRLLGDAAPRPDRRRRNRGRPARPSPPPSLTTRAPRTDRSPRTARPSWFSLSPRPSHLPRDRARAGRAGRPRVFQILPVIMATCALGLMVAIFTVIGHGKTETMSQTRGTQCVPAVVNSCQPQDGSAGPSAKGRAG
jgi:Protein of unknown function (DUF3040)